MKRGAPKKFIECEFCKAVLKSEVYYQRHKEARHPAVPVRFICDFDGKEFVAKNYLRIHMERHKNNVYVCNVCCRAYNSRVSFRRHLMSHIEKFSCSQCNASFSHKNLLNNHVASHHMDELPFKCKFCTRMFASKSARNNHHQTHKDKSELNFKCQDCQIFFETKEDLRIHSFVHYEGEIKTCHVCEQIFKTNRLLNIHLQKHASKKFQCDSCQEHFVFRSGLMKHIRLNRCKGPPPQLAMKEPLDSSETLTEEKIQEIAKEQLSEISNLLKKGNCEDVSHVESEKPMLELDMKNYGNDNSNDDDDEEDAEKNQNLEEQWEPIRRNGRAHLTYTCDQCGESIKFRKNVEAHMRERHLSRRTYSCSHCMATFKSRRLYKEHALETHGVIECTKYECDMCGRKFDVRSIFLAHKLSHEQLRIHKCDLCTASFKSIGNLKRHQFIHRDTRDFLCDVCAKSFKTKPALKMHRAIHADFHVYVNCPYCKTICKEKNLKVHIFNQHGEGQAKPHECPTCQKCFKNEFLLKRHVDAVHENASRGFVYKCSDCESSFNRMNDLRMHSFEHFSGQVFSCDECGKKFRNKRLLLNHSLVHAPVKFPCNLCDASFQTAGGRRKHIARHHKATTNTVKVESIDFAENEIFSPSF